VALRPEPFGALAYHYDTRRLNFLRSHDLVALVASLADHPSPRAAFDASDIDPARWPAFSKALVALAASGFIESATSDATPPPSRLSEESA
jgi:putative mycofactocin binding protein MftB